MNLDYKFSNNLSSKYSWSGQSKLNEYRGYAWMAVKNLDPGIVTNTTESMNTSYNPSVLKWLRPSFNYTASYRWSDDLSREGQNISAQLRMASNFTLTPVKFFEVFYKPPTKKRTGKRRTRTSRSREETEEPNNGKSTKKESKEFKSLSFIHGLFDKVNPISVSYTETLNRSANQIIGDVPMGYKFGWLPNHG